jgi:hypothetical protein
MNFVVSRVPVNTWVTVDMLDSGTEKEPKVCPKPVPGLLVVRSTVNVPPVKPDGALAASRTEYVVLGWMIATLYVS